MERAFLLVDYQQCVEGTTIKCAPGLTTVPRNVHQNYSWLVQFDRSGKILLAVDWKAVFWNMLLFQNCLCITHSLFNFAEKLGVISASGWTPVATMARSRMSFAVCLLNVLRGCLVEGRVFL